MSTELNSVPAEQKLQLENLLPDYCALTWRQFTAFSFWSLLFLFLCYQPVSNSLTWQSVNEAAFNNVFEKSVILPLSAGMRSITIGTSGKQFSAMLFQAGGSEFLGLGFAVLQVTAFGLWSLVLYRIFPSSWSLAAGVGIAIASFSQLDGFHTGIFGQICGALLVLNLFSQLKSDHQLHWSKARRYQWLAIFLTMVLWTNLDASFVLGLGGLAIFASAQFWKSKPTSFSSLRASFSDPELHHRVWLFECGCIATVLTPQGIGLWKSMLWWPDNPLLAELGPSLPAALASWSTVIIAFCWAIWATLVVRTKQTPSTTFTLLSICSTVLACLNHELIFWFAAAMAMAIILLISKSHRTNEQTSKITNHSSNINPIPSSFKFAFTLLTGLIIWLAFCFSPFGSKVLGGSQRTQSQIVGSTLPVSGKQFLQKHKTALLHCPVYWSDWLAAGSNQSFMVNRGSQNTPLTANQDYQLIYRGGGEWRKKAEKYNLTGLFVDKANQQRLVQHLRRRPGKWENVYEDTKCIIYQRSL